MSLGLQKEETGQTKQPNMEHIIRHKSAIRLLAFVLLLVAAAVPMCAQTGLQVEKVFERYGRARGCKFVVMHDTKLRGYKLHVYKALTYRRGKADVSTYLKADRRAAKKVREVVDNGRIVSGYYMMSPAQGGMNRYILFSDVPGNPGAVIYIEGHLSPDDIMKMCYIR